ncbi:zinc-dependent alcohol dehydrogenase [Pseudacidobacterium ailaaui]|jgi:L-iditol 2-dehydrogenase|uniref:zinc-dependent alcohol dehydrogenase n=1 Tax=Pseudacidobacterium ailaaui TaxID=1382359 RepID=UPI00047C5D84|nr:alcohol dehydrogenase catalytic domain-containing protein [Pseudacidobacterium ailaaui]MDI3254931.1 alcohol dehydrogenase catalytic domain-containing protein [Bacillota bacterium]
MPNTMTAAVLYGKEDLRIERLPIPSAGPGEIVVRIAAALTCGTDLKVYRRGYHAKMLRPPIPFGHELAGTVAEVGPGVTKFRAGDRVVALNSAPCDQCYYCSRGQQNLCDDLLFNNGAYAEYLRVPARIVAKNTLHVPENVPLEHAALTEPLACVVRGLEETNPRPGDSIAVIGAGPIGLMFMHAAQLSGLRVIAIVKRDEQIAAAKTFGAEEIVQITAVDDVVAAVRALTPDHRGVDIAVEAVATPAAWQQAVAIVRKGGTVNFFGGCAAGTTVELDTNRLHYNDITLKATFHHTPETARRAFDLISSGRFKCREYITGRAPLSEIGDVFHRLMDRSSDIKTAIIP